MNRNYKYEHYQGQALNALGAGNMEIQYNPMAQKGPPWLTDVYTKKINNVG